MTAAVSVATAPQAQAFGFGDVWDKAKSAASVTKKVLEAPKALQDKINREARDIATEVVVRGYIKATRKVAEPIYKRLPESWRDPRKIPITPEDWDEYEKRTNDAILGGLRDAENRIRREAANAKNEVKQTIKETLGQGRYTPVAPKIKALPHPGFGRPMPPSRPASRAQQQKRNARVTPKVQATAHPGFGRIVPPSKPAARPQRRKDTPKSDPRYSRELNSVLQKTTARARVKGSTLQDLGLTRDRNPPKGWDRSRQGRPVGFAIEKRKPVKGIARKDLGLKRDRKASKARDKSRLGRPVGLAIKKRAPVKGITRKDLGLKRDRKASKARDKSRQGRPVGLAVEKQAPTNKVQRLRNKDRKTSRGEKRGRNIGNRKSNRRETRMGVRPERAFQMRRKRGSKRERRDRRS